MLDDIIIQILIQFQSSLKKSEKFTNWPFDGIIKLLLLLILLLLQLQTLFRIVLKFFEFFFCTERFAV